jgi:Lar family restriction alleviation protein
MATELKPCPFCGGVATHWFCTANGLYVTKFFGQMLRGLKAEYNMICCNKCGCRTKVYAQIKNAFKAWNRRAEDDRS